jgi:ubiquinone/menaquinone biosynthesis C-methylase UbiE
MEIEQQLKAAGEAFSKQSLVFDEIDIKNPILQWMRKRVRGHVSGLIKPGSHILELNAGTGLDAVFFATAGHTVHATDVSGGMVKALNQKVESSGLHDLVYAEVLSFTDLIKLPADNYDFIFSNFGGLNCIPDLKPVINEFRRLLKPGGRVTLVIMPKVCPWEICSILKGNTKLAFRRFKRGGAPSNVEGVGFKSWYFNPKDVVRDFGKDFKIIKWEGLGSLVPPPHHVRFPERFPVLFRLLTTLDEHFSSLPFFRTCADHFILSMEFQAG